MSSKPNEEAGEAGEGKGEEAPAPAPAPTEGTTHKLVGPMGARPALEVVESAALAVGLTPAQLVDLIADSGLLALPPDGATEQVTLSELGAHLRTQLSQTPPLARPDWFAKLAEVQQGALVVALRNHGSSSHSVSASFQIEPMHVQRLYNEHCDKVGQNVTNVRLTTIVGHMQLVAERAQHGAMEKNDWSTYWRIQKDLIANLQSLGIVDKAIHRVEVMHTLDDRAKENIERLAQLRIKQNARKAEISVVATATEDEVPDEFKEFDDE